MNETITNIDLLSTATELGEAMQDAEPLQEFRAARKNFNNDQDAVKLYNDFVMMQREIQIANQYGGDSGAEQNKLTELERKLFANKNFDNFIKAQNNLLEFLQKVNSQISEELPFDFASLAKPAGSSCCG
ncbi:MAG: YlbF family regulator [Melioribacteraceae bacterium]|nr:YlbF family regulator [Melioribacteraceae bacterium]